MLEGLIQIGKIAKSNSKVWEIAIDKISKKKGIKKYIIAKIKFNTKTKQIEIDINEEYSDDESGKEYKFIQLGLTGRQNQFFGTFRDIKRLVGEKGKPHSIWLSIKEELSNLDADYSQDIKILDIVKEVFYPDGVLDCSKISKIGGETNLQIKNNKDIEKVIKSALGSKENIAFYTIYIDDYIDDKKLVDRQFYEDILSKKIVDEKKESGKAVCYICKKSLDEYFVDLARMPLGFYINDKMGFSQNLSGRFEGSFVMCKDCYETLYAGQKFIYYNFRDEIGLIDYIIVPQFVKEPSYNCDQLKKWSKYIDNCFNPFKLIDNNEIENKLKEYREFKDEENTFLLNYIFYEENNSQFKVYHVINDVPKSRIEKLLSIFKSFSDDFKKKFPSLTKHMLRYYYEIYYLIPLRLQKEGGKKRIGEIPKITSVFSSIINGTIIDSRMVVKEFAFGIRVKLYNNGSYHIGADTNNDDYKLCDYLLKTNQFLILLKYLYGGKNGMDINNILTGIPQEFMEYIRICGFGEPECGLFLLGTLIGDIGSKQAKQAMKSEKKGSKPILNKINFQGMPIDRIKILTNEVYYKLAQEKLLYPAQEKIFATAKKLIDENLNKWGLHPHENVYYLMSGYAFKTALKINSATNKKENNKEVDNE